MSLQRLDRLREYSEQMRNNTLAKKPSVIKTVEDFLSVVTEDEEEVESQPERERRALAELAKPRKRKIRKRPL
jgi:hypothetical protein